MSLGNVIGAGGAQDSGLTDAGIAASATPAWGYHSRITSGNPGDTVTLAASSTSEVGKVLELYNATGVDLVLAVNGADSIIGLPADLSIPDNSGVSARIVAANTIEVVGVGKPLEEVSGVNGYVIIGNTMIQWGVWESTSDGPEEHFFPTAFGGIPYNLNLQYDNEGANAGANGVTFDGTTLTAASVFVNRETAVDNNVGSGTPLHFIAIGPKP